MKKGIFTLLMVISAVAGMSQTIGEAFYVYRNDGMINTFFRSEIDSIAYSYYDADSLLYDEIVSQVVYTPDSIYKIPLAVIDSVGFVTPKTEYQPDVISLEGAIRDYVIGSDSLTIYFRSNTPFNILPKTGDKLVTTEISDVFWGGFLGKVVDKEERGDTIALHCDAIDLEEAYKCFYYSTNGTSQSNFNKSRAKGLEWDGYYAPDPFVYSSTNFLETFFQPINCPITFTPKFEISIAPTFGSKGSIIVHPLRGVVINMDIHQHTFFAEDLAVSGEIGLSKDISLIPGPIPMYPILPFVSIYGDLGVVFKANGKLTLEEHWGQSLDFDIHYETSYQPLLPMTISTSIPKLKISNVNFTTGHNGRFMFEASGAFGGYGEIGIVPWLLKKVAKVGFRFEGGLKLEGNVMLYNSDGEGALQSTSCYDKLRAGTLSLKSFCSVGMDAKLIGVGAGGVNFYDNEWPLAKYKIVPDFTNTKLTRNEDTPSTLIATTTAFGSTIFPCSLGFKMFDGAENDGFKGIYSHSYSGITGEPETYWDSFLLMPLTKTYSVYPTVELLGIEMLASPSAELDTSLKPVTLHVEDITETTAKVWGRIEGHELIDETMTFGLGFEEVGGTGTFLYDASSIDSNGVFSVDLVGLKPNTKHTYFAYLDIDGQRIFGEEKEFTTTNFENAKAYAVLSDNTLTFYYDDKQTKRVGSVFNISFFYNKFRNYEGWYEAVHIIDFAPSFIYYTPTSTYYWFYSFHNLTEVRNINRLNTSKTTSMEYLFYNCRSLKSLDLRSFDTSKVTNMQLMFSSCSSLTDLDISSFDTSNVTNMYAMFSDCSSLTDLDISSFDTRKVTTMHSMFYECISIKILDLSHFKVTEGTDVGSMFCRCNSLTTIYAGNWSPVGHYTFSGCFNLIGEKGTKVGVNYYIDENGVQRSYTCSESYGAAHIDGGKDWPGLFTAK